jgi:dTDP-4-amino-4,6-dideoxygalactose transaminase
MNVPFFTLEFQNKQFKEEVLASIAQTIDRGDFILGEDLLAFESNFAQFCEAPYALGVSNGTAAIYMALKTLGVEAGDEVLLPSATYTATALAIIHLGAIPVFVDIKPDTWTIDLDDAKGRISSKTKAIIGVHLYGNPCKMDELVLFAQQHHLFLIEDAAQAHGASFEGKKVGSWGDMAGFSFYPSKNLGSMGDAGAVTFKDSKLLALANGLRNCGKDALANHKYPGFNYRMTSFQACVLKAKLPHLDSFNEKRKKIASFYKANIQQDKVQWQKVQEGGDAVYHLFVLKVDNREKFIQYLQQNGIGFSFHYKVPVHLQEVYQSYNFKEGDLPVTESLYARCVSIPLFPEMSEEQMARVVAVVNAY